MKAENGHSSAASAGDNDSGIVITSRVRLARNVKDFPFPGWLKKADRLKLLEQIQPTVSDLSPMRPAKVSAAMETLSPLEKQLLVEKHLISREHAAKNAGSGLVVNPDESLSVMINEEDHLRLQALRPGFHLQEAWEAADKLDSALEDKLEFSFSPSLGYLTACPTNVGTGMRASAMLHLPGLVLGEQINQVIKSVNQLGLAVRGLYGEGTEALGNLFQISNQTTLGESEKQILDRLIKVVRQLIELENNARQKLIQEKARMLADQVGRSYGIVLHSYSISSKEALNLLSLLRLAADLALLPANLKTKLDTLLISTQPAHLQQASQKKLGAEERDAFRADLLRDKLKGVPEPAMRKLHL
jgi:protein arginine kinase